MKDSDHKDVYAINRIGPGKCQLTWETVDVHSCGVYNSMLDFYPFALLHEVTLGLSKSLHKAITNALPQTMASAPTLGRIIQKKS